MTWYVSETAESNMEDFFRTVGEVSNLIEKVCCEVDQVEMSHGVILSTPNKEKKNKEKLEQHNKEIKKNANLIRAKLKTMQKDFPVAENSRSASVIHRIQRNQHSHLTRRFADIMKGYHKAQISFREKCKVQIQRQLDVVNKPTTDEELEEMLQCDNLSIFVSDINSNAQISSQALSKIESRHQDILCLESSIEELHEIFADTAMLLESQRWEEAGEPGENPHRHGENMQTAESWTQTWNHLAVSAALLKNIVVNGFLCWIKKLDFSVAYISLVSGIMTFSVGALFESSRISFRIQTTESKVHHL
ncbi:syntaxin-2-like isoform X1 [Antennarius striatus]|uniref:syntaxin-2-like isoform X1 n=1 Tax=Antennarius striatus TaxID=241820 RepID=UPI0035ADFAC4